MWMSEASDATTEQYFSRERSIARRALPSSAPSPVTVNTKCSAMKRRGCSARRVPCTSTRRAEQPRRFIALHFVFTVTGDGADEGRARRAIDLSLEKYCSVVASLASDIHITYDV